MSPSTHHTKPPCFFFFPRFPRLLRGAFGPCGQSDINKDDIIVNPRHPPPLQPGKIGDIAGLKLRIKLFSTQQQEPAPASSQQSKTDIDGMMESIYLKPPIIFTKELNKNLTLRLSCEATAKTTRGFRGGLLVTCSLTHSL